MIRFTKMHGIGNDYIYVNAFEQRISDPAALSRAIADRHFGVGADGLILILPPEKGVSADVRMRMFNADGSESEMCGNGIRCVCKYAHDHDLSKANPMRVQTGRGVLTLKYTVNGTGTVNQVTVDMGEPILDLPGVPVDASKLRPVQRKAAHRLELADSQSAGGAGHPALSTQHPAQSWIGAFASMGNPHAVFFDADNPQIKGDGLKRLELDRIGPRIETHPAFPRRINAHFVQVHSPGEVTMRTWERGTGATLACGTGASAVCVAGVLTGLTDRKIRAHLPGGDLVLEWDEKSNHVFMTGPATEIFSGEWPG